MQPKHFSIHCSLALGNTPSGRTNGGQWVFSLIMKWRLYYEKGGGHVHCRLFCGPHEGALGKCGDLCFREKEFTEFTRINHVLGIDFRRECNGDGSLRGDDDVKFDQR